jgi:hypothetical protein
LGLLVVNNQVGPPVIVLITSLGSPASILVYDPLTLAHDFSKRETHISLSAFLVNAIYPFLTGMKSSTLIHYHSPFKHILTP